MERSKKGGHKTFHGATRKIAPFHFYISIVIVLKGGFGVQKCRSKVQKYPFSMVFLCNIQYLARSDPDITRISIYVTEFME